MRFRGLRWTLQEEAGAGGAAAGGDGAGGAAAAAGAAAGAAGGDGKPAAGAAAPAAAAGDKAAVGGKPAAGAKGAAAGAPDWRVAIAGEDQDVLNVLKDIENPRALYDSHIKSTKWREELAGDNADALKTLERFASPKALWDSYDALRGRMSKGELKATSVFPEKGTDEQKSAWRAENGVPVAPDKYEIKLPTGIEITDADKPMIEGFTKFAHGKNLPQGAVNDVVNWYFAEQIQGQERALEAFEGQRTSTAAELGREWGVEYKANLNRIQGVIDSTVPADQKELKEAINRAIATNPHFARHYAAIALQLNPAGTLVPGDRGANEASVADEIKKIEKTIRTDRKTYDKDNGMQTRYRELLGAYEKMAKKSWGT